jgi:3-isopropylmalate/(R)-2-methylmalate dehydratase small subunit
MTQALTTHRVWKFGADIDTDVLAPGAYMKLGIEDIARHCLESVRPEFAREVKPGDVIVAGRSEERRVGKECS